MSNIKQGIFWGSVLLGAAGCHYANQHLQTDHFVYHHEKVPASFNGFRILHISDLHNTLFGIHQQRLIKQIKAIQPDIIVISGDLLDKRRSTKRNLHRCLSFTSQAMRLAPVYFVPGNHEAASELYPYVREQLLLQQVIVLENSKVTFTRNQESITLLGAKDPRFYRDNPAQFYQRFAALSSMRDAAFTMLLCHRPELIDLYAEQGIDVCFCGHAHGGQVRLPGIGGLYAPNQGIFPRYTNGRYQKQETTMFVSRGLGNSRAPLRIYNRPHLICVTLYASF